MPISGSPRPNRRLGVLGVLVALAVLMVSGLGARDGLAPGEKDLFVAINSLPDALYPVIWPFMQYGVFITIPLLTVICLLLRRRRLAIGIAVAGVGVYLLARIAKSVVERGRPAALIEGVHERESFVPGSLGYPSGHAAVAAGITAVATSYLEGRWKLVPIALLATVSFGRMYVGAHMPLDLVGGAALGFAAGCTANLVVRRSSENH